jgi:hypothetical protein
MQYAVEEDSAASLPTASGGDRLTGVLPVVVPRCDSGVAVIPTTRSSSTGDVVVPASASSRSVAVAEATVSNAIVLLLFDGLLATFDGVPLLATMRRLVYDR